MGRELRLKQRKEKPTKQEMQNKHEIPLENVSQWRNLRSPGITVISSTPQEPDQTPRSIESLLASQEQT